MQLEWHMEREDHPGKAKGEKHNWEDKHQVDAIAHSNHIIKQWTIWNSKITIKIGKHIVQCLVTKKKNSKQAGSDIDRRAQCKRCSHYWLHLGGINQFILYRVNCKMCLNEQIIKGLMATNNHEKQPVPLWWKRDRLLPGRSSRLN